MINVPGIRDQQERGRCTQGIEQHGRPADMKQRERRGDGFFTGAVAIEHVGLQVIHEQVERTEPGPFRHTSGATGVLQIQHVIHGYLRVDRIRVGRQVVMQRHDIHTVPGFLHAFSLASNQIHGPGHNHRAQALHLAQYQWNGGLPERHQFHQDFYSGIAGLVNNFRRSH